VEEKAERKDFEVMEYVEMSLPELRALDPGKTVFMISVSPIEVHGPHLPVGTDVFISDDLARRYMEELHKRRPELVFVKLPSLYVGSDALPVAGSLSVPAVHLEGVLTAYGKGLARQGFRYLFVADNHGGPRHQMGVEAAARTLWRKHRFYLIDPFGADFRYMVQHDPKFMSRTSLGPGVCGDDPDCHAGTNETSLMLVCSPERVREGFRSVKASLPPARRGAAAFVGGLAAFVRLLGGSTLGRDLDHLANTLAWVSDPDMIPYMGDPGRATREAGEAMLAARVEVAMELFERALASGTEPVHIQPMLWGVRIMKKMPE
jgi:creatinine amidohydrolase/Fe(II)-dependent formamide hydrolase-like protein